MLLQLEETFILMLNFRLRLLGDVFITAMLFPLLATCLSHLLPLLRSEYFATAEIVSTDHVPNFHSHSTCPHNQHLLSHVMQHCIPFVLASEVCHHTRLATDLIAQDHVITRFINALARLLSKVTPTHVCLRSEGMSYVIIGDIY